MPYKLNWEDEGYYLHMWGAVTTEDMHDSLHEIWGNIKSDRMNYCIRDYLDVTKVDINMSDECVSAYVSNFEKMSVESSGRPLKYVAFLSENEDMDHLIEGYTILMKEYNPTAVFKSFSNMKDARQWVGSVL